MPLNPTTVCDSGVNVNMAASGTCLAGILKGHQLPQDNTDFKDHSWLHLLSKFNAVDRLIILGAYDLIIAPLHITISNTIFAITDNNAVEILVCRGG